MYVIFSIDMFDAISLIHIPILGPSAFFQLIAIIHLACNTRMSTNVSSLLCKFRLVGYKLRTRSLGSSGNVFDHIWSIILIISCQKNFTFTHSHTQWYNVLLASLHLTQVSGMLSLNICNLTVVMHVCMSHLYCISFKLLLTLGWTVVTKATNNKYIIWKII